MWLLGMLSDNRDRLGRGDVVVWTPVLFSRGIEVLFDDLLASRESVSSAHQRQLWQRGGLLFG